jgi:hypothetical protein
MAYVGTLDVDLGFRLHGCEVKANLAPGKKPKVSTPRGEESLGQGWPKQTRYYHARE